MAVENPHVPPIELQKSYWTSWNSATREKELGDIPLRQQEVLLKWLKNPGRRDLKIIDFGCGAGWLCQDLVEFGAVTGVDLVEEVLVRARERMPNVTFIAGDLMAPDLGAAQFDVVISLEVLSHVADQQAFADRLSHILRPGGVLIMSTQNRPILERNDIKPTWLGQLRRWVDSHELRRLLSPRFNIRRIARVKEWLGLGWTLMVYAEKPR
jgi:2-polyprenyl-3-methyl-5-hydroxy-6-metoxy-1,4-benzoquinol methylase